MIMGTVNKIKEPYKLNTTSALVHADGLVGASMDSSSSNAVFIHFVSEDKNEAVNTTGLCCGFEK